MTSWRIGIALALACLGSQAVASTPQLIGEFGAWQAFRSGSEQETTCFALSQPVERLPEHLNRDPGYLFFSFWPDSTGAGEVGFRFGYPLDPQHTATMSIGDESFALMARDENAWLANDADSASVAQALRRELRAEVEAKSQRGNDTRDIYSLRGFTRAYRAISNACK